MRTNAHQSLHRYKIAYSPLDNGSTRRISQQCGGLQRRWRTLLAMLVGCTLLIFCYWTFQSMGNGSPFLIEQQANEEEAATTFIQEDPLPAKEKSTAASRNDAQTKKASQIHSATFSSDAKNFAQNSSAFKIVPFTNRTSNFSMPRPEIMAEMNECAEKPPNLIGPIPVWLDGPEMAKLEELNSDVGAGGHWWPQECRARHRVAIIVPYRDREKHLHIFLHNLHSFLQKQQLDYGIFIVEQMANQTFNRGKLMNVGFVEASRLYGWQCFIFHDVDLLPEDDRNIYSCPQQPRHMSVAVDKFKYKLPYKSLFGGAEAVNRKQFEKMNGFSNDYWGWGGEDDDISARIVYAGLQISRYPATIARYKMIKHTKEQLNPVNDCRYGLLAKTKMRWRRDGLTNLDYRLIAVHFDRLYTNITVDLLEVESRRALSNEHIKEGC